MNRIAKHSKATEQLLAKGQKNAVRLFHKTANSVPAYKKFLSKQGIRPNRIRRFKDLSKIPPVNKENYLRAYPLEELAPSGDLFTANLISVSSGSTGKPFYWLRGDNQHEEAAGIYENIYRNIFQCDQKKTLLVVCFSMGTWIAGSYTTLGALMASKRGLKMNVITPALDLYEAIASIKELHSHYEQIILAGYPPLIKDLVDLGSEEGVNWKKLGLGYTLAGEAVTEELREYLMEKAGTHNPCRVINIYGTADAGIVAHETPLSIIIRRHLSGDFNKVQEVFGRPVLPTLASYDPRIRYFEEHEGRLVFTAPAGIPLVRYDIKDSGGVIPSVKQMLGQEDFKKVEAELRKYGHDANDWQWPFTYVHGRADFTATLYAVLIYPENIKSALLRAPLNKLATGKFVMETQNDPKLDQYLKLVIELKQHVEVTKAVKELFLDHVISTLKEQNSEYRKLSTAVGERAIPHIELCTYGDERYFAKGNKHRWVPRRD